MVQCNNTKGVWKELQKDRALAKCHDDHGRTMLGWASYRGHLEMSVLLLEHGADIEDCGKNGETPLILAARGTTGAGAENVTRLLLSYGANIEAKNENGSTPLKWSAVCF